MSLAAERSFLPSHLPSLYCQVMSPKTLQSQSARVYCFHNISPFPQPLNAQDNYFTWHLLTGTERFTPGSYPGSPYIQPSYHWAGSFWISSILHQSWDTDPAPQLPTRLVHPINKWLLYALCIDSPLSTVAVLPKAGQWLPPRDTRHQ